MRLQSLHNHTSFCDGEGTVEDFCHVAAQRKFQSIGFSAHAPLPPATGFESCWHLRQARFEEYCVAVRAAGAIHNNATASVGSVLEVFLGLESDHIEGRAKADRFDMDALGLDYLIGSVHLIIAPDDNLTYGVDEKQESFDELITKHFDGDVNALVDLYWNNEEHMIEAGGFDILGHVDLIK
jgi:histidinol-phosphatase (PHP family)